MYKIKILLFFLFSLFFVLALFRSVNSYAMKPYGVMITGEAAIIDDISEKMNALESILKKYVPEGGYIGLTEEMVENHLSKLNRRTTIIKIKINEIIGKERP